MKQQKAQSLLTHIMNLSDNQILQEEVFITKICSLFYKDKKELLNFIEYNKDYADQSVLLYLFLRSGFLFIGLKFYVYHLFNKNKIQNKLLLLPDHRNKTLFKMKEKSRYVVNK